MDSGESAQSEEAQTGQVCAVWYFPRPESSGLVSSMYL